MCVGGGGAVLSPIISLRDGLGHQQWPLVSLVALNYAFCLATKINGPVSMIQGLYTFVTRLAPFIGRQQWRPLYPWCGQRSLVGDLGTIGIGFICSPGER